MLLYAAYTFPSSYEDTSFIVRMLLDPQSHLIPVITTESAFFYIHHVAQVARFLNLIQTWHHHLDPMIRLNISSPTS